MVKQYGQLLRETRARLSPTEGELAAQTARELLSMASGKSVAALLADQELYASESIEARLGDFFVLYHEMPVAHGKRGFFVRHDDAGAVGKCLKIG